MCPFPICPLYTQAEILFLDKPIADCFLFRPRKRLEKSKKRSHTNVSNASVTRTSRVSQTLLQTPLPCFHASINEYYTAKNGLGTIAPRLLLQVKVGTHSPLPTGSHTAAYTAKHGPSGQGRYHYPRSVPHVHKYPRAGCQNGVLCRFGILAGRCSRRTQKAFGTAMRLCVSLSRRRRGPAGPRCSVCNLVMLLFFHSARRAFRTCERGGAITTLGVLCVLLKRRTTACQKSSFAAF